MSLFALLKVKSSFEKKRLNHICSVHFVIQSPNQVVAWSKVLLRSVDICVCICMCVPHYLCVRELDKPSETSWIEIIGLDEASTEGSGHCHLHHLKRIYSINDIANSLQITFPPFYGQENYCTVSPLNFNKALIMYLCSGNRKVLTKDCMGSCSLLHPVSKGHVNYVYGNFRTFIVWSRKFLLGVPWESFGVFLLHLAIFTVRDVLDGIKFSHVKQERGKKEVENSLNF